MDLFRKYDFTINGRVIDGGIFSYQVENLSFDFCFYFLIAVCETNRISVVVLKLILIIKYRIAKMSLQFIRFCITCTSSTEE